MPNRVTNGETFEGAYDAREPQTALAALRHRNQIGDRNLLIAAAARGHDLALVTRHLRDFRLVPGLSIHEGAVSEPSLA